MQALVHVSTCQGSILVAFCFLSHSQIWSFWSCHVFDAEHPSGDYRRVHAHHGVPAKGIGPLRRDAMGMPSPRAMHSLL